MEQQKKKPKAKYICDRCGKTFQQKQNLRRHIKSIHVNSTKRKCPKCSRQLSRNDNLRRHLKGHEQKFRAAVLYTSRHDGILISIYTFVVKRIYLFVFNINEKIKYVGFS